MSATALPEVGELDKALSLDQHGIEPIPAVVMTVMTVLALSKGHIVWGHSTVHGSRLIAAASELLTAVGIGWGCSWAPWASDYSRFTRPELTEKRVYCGSAYWLRSRSRPLRVVGV